ncbi:hypothetical protein CB1_001118025 [Camelus ferus]|nr:hypothetical protein CB1_001118025 [Camelus ferus]
MLWGSPPMSECCPELRVSQLPSHVTWRMLGRAGVKKDHEIVPASWRPPRACPSPSCHGNRFQGDEGGCWVLFPSGPVSVDFQTSDTVLLCPYPTILCPPLGRVQTSSLASRTMCTSLTTCEWKKVFYEKMEVAKPADSWELIIDPNLKPNELAPGWKQYLEQHASGRGEVGWGGGGYGQPCSTAPGTASKGRQRYLEPDAGVSSG